MVPSNFLAFAEEEATLTSQVKVYWNVSWGGKRASNFLGNSLNIFNFLFKEKQKGHYKGERSWTANWSERFQHKSAYISKELQLNSGSSTRYSPCHLGTDTWHTHIPRRHKGIDHAPVHSAYSIQPSQVTFPGPPSLWSFSVPWRQ